MRFNVQDYNGILTDLKTKLAGHLTTPRDADALILWQDAQGSWADLLKTAKQVGQWKPTFVVQHGKSASLDYDEPNKFPLLADKFLCWGTSDYDRMCKLGYKDRVKVVGCPLNTKIKPAVKHREKIILFVPVNTGKEEPENIAIYYKLLQMKYKCAENRVLNLRKELKNKWGINDKVNVPFNELAINFDVAAKLLPWHDKSLYHGNAILGYQDMPKNNELIFNLLRNVDLVVGLDEGCTEVYAYGHDVPVVIVDGFQYRQHKDDGKTFAIMETYKTKAAVHCTIDELPEVVQHELAHPEHMKKERAEVAEAELGLSYGDATSNIYNLVRRETKNLSHI